jgi:hypothetical protein
MPRVSIDADHNFTAYLDGEALRDHDEAGRDLLLEYLGAPAHPLLRLPG